MQAVTLEIKIENGNTTKTIGVKVDEKEWTPKPDVQKQRESSLELTGC